ncbi:hypothetical protein MJO28_003502 [Puccinia striiformis f. sp. tritici]|uniref:Uncharacterized protein n=1 Tax=Puccinia striiformis f. sp. tritici TaxID=168172 RepID=A0ACC0ESM6_9BASI|nr:hypothetical protein MJO28_003502 [Puccinia striiformis f. sp. tritici]
MLLGTYAVMVLTLFSTVQLAQQRRHSLSSRKVGASQQQCGIRFRDHGPKSKATCVNYAAVEYQCDLSTCHTGGRYDKPETHPLSAFKFQDCHYVNADQSLAKDGIPIHPAFYKASNLKGELRARDSLDDKYYLCKWKKSTDINNTRFCL